VVVGNHVRVKVIKNKVAPPLKTAEFDIIFGEGIDHAGYLVDMAVDAEIIDKSGAFFSYKSEKIGQGRENVKAYLMANPTVMAEIEAEIKKKLMVSKDAQPEGLADTKTPAKKSGKEECND